MAGKREVDWLTGSKIEASTKLSNEHGRAKSMQKRASGKNRCWASDGEFVWFRRKIATPAFVNRLTTQIAKGELKHLTTQDDVEIYQIQESSPLKRATRDLGAVDLQTLTREARISACRRDWATFVDALEELAFRLKNAVYSDGKPAREDFMREVYSDRVTHIFNMIKLAGGPSQMEIDREVQALRQKRGAAQRRVMTLGGR